MEILMEYEEALNLKGHMDKVYVFAEDAAETKSRIAQRGQNGATRYFLIPKELRSHLNAGSKVKCQRIDTKKNTLFLYIVEKM
ncbi:hypothetical protein D6764_01600 [Candidatus Woesearchaeota archaeon]|nr:MAG: hypothetical protein D6764_01600 [Candidatus Woesearchaeota archaeon]